MSGVARPLDLGVAPVSGPAAHTGEDALSTLISLVEADLEACNRVIVAQMDSPVALIPQLAAHIVAAGGKRLRPLLTLASARLCGYPHHGSPDQGSPDQGSPDLDGRARHIDLAACVE
ncbi:MAG: octaprenyl-diphosphate synthase, partial [Acetobacteraceae bacterium]|nr:octaprenyl-diphosphate synthase [Acetobacteraceae bacterium]